MAVVTSTEAGGTGRYLRYDDAALDDMGAQTIIVYAKPSGSGGGVLVTFTERRPQGLLVVLACLWITTGVHLN